MSSDEIESARRGVKATTRGAALFALAGLVAGAGAGWLARGAQKEASLAADAPAPATSGSASPSTDPCATLEKDVCASAGDTSAACGYAKGATVLLTSGLCETARGSVPAMIEKVKAARRVCDELVARICQEVGPQSAGCSMARERTAAFGPQRCVELTAQYSSVVEELRQLERRGMIPGSTATPSAPAPSGQGAGGLPPR